MSGIRITTSRPPSTAVLLGLLGMFSLVAPPPAAAAYVDPTSGSIMLQVAAAGILAAAYTFRRWLARTGDLVRSVWARLTGR